MSTTTQQMSVIARTEWRLITRNKTVLLSATLMPLAVAGMIAIQGVDQPDAGVGMSAMLIGLFTVLSIYLTVTITAVSRRQDLYLKRLRSGESSDVAIFGGLVIAPAVLCLGQLVVVFAILLAMGLEVPAQPWWLAVAVVGAVAMNLAAAVGTAAITPNPTAAQMSTVPFFFLVIGTLFASPFADNRFMDLTPGGALVTLARLAYEMPTPGAALSAIAGLVVWTAIGWEIAKRYFRWEPRA
ncbi:ABC transporter permease [Aeromicrobium camelliae]|uniref:ABC transporter permease n=1 Tax=Aeromicrobium camelliae TaxID=1538144 RepID=A0A3N6YEI6_9ACTN|nr:ABC transporter permease [Aeromicrobium camelliae]RQN08224.1 ABC transporter permease [Aeromicrobium camelliae]